MAIAPGIFRQYDIRGVVGDDLTVEAARALGGAYAALLHERGVTGEVAVGRDNRPSGSALRDALVGGLTAAGVNVVDIGVVPTPLLYWSLHHLGVAGGIQITGSHNPPEYNGFKLCLGTESLHGGDIQHLLALIRRNAAPNGKGSVRHEQVIDRYVADVAKRVGRLSRPMRIVYDCGNGAGALVAPQLMQAIGATGTGLFCESDGTFPNHHPDPTVPENLADLISTVKREGAELGIAFDGDADRIGLVDDRGRIVWGDHILILYARDVLERTGRGQPIIFDVKCSQALPHEIERAGGIPQMWKTGHSLIKDRMKELQAPLAGEMSGHMFFGEGFYGHDDALYGAARLLRIVADSGRSVRELLADVPAFVSTPEIRVDCADDRKFEVVARAVEHFRAIHDVDDVDGVRVLFGDGWGLVRASNTQPILVLRFEARSEHRLQEIRDEMEGWLRSQGVTAYVTVRRVVIGVLATAAVVLVLGRWSTGVYTDYLWYESLGAASLWRARLATVLVLWVASFTVASVFAFANLWAVRRSVVSLVLPRRIANVEIGEEVPGRYLLVAVVLLSFVVGVALALPSSAWSRALLPQIGQPFGETDPYFGADLGFFVYWLPLEIMLHEWSVILLAVVVVLVVLLYALTPSLRWEGSQLYVSSYVRRHFMILGGVLMLVLAWSYRLDMYRLVAMGDGTGGAFTAVDHRVLVPATLLLAVVTFCAALVVCWAGWSGQMRLAFLAVTTVLLLSVLARSVAPLLARRSVDPAVAAAQERPYVATRHGYTRRAYGVDRMRPDTLGAGFATAADAAPRVAIWDGETLAAAAERLRRVRVVGDGASWQAGSAALTALLVERSSDAGADGRDAWGIGRFDATAADDRGMPVRIPGATRGMDETVFDEPAVYDSAPSYSVISDSLRRVAGVEMVSTRSRIAHAWALQNLRLLFGELPLDRPMIVRRRDVRERLRALVPFFVQGSEVLPVMAEDSLYWSVELYSASDSYPLSERFVLLGDERGYFQHAATALLDAVSGRVRLVLDANADPVASSWASRFPQLFTSMSALPAPLRAALPPITDGARAQALAFATSGFRGDSLEVRHFATLDGADASAPHEPLHFALPDGVVAVGWPLLDDRDRVRGIVAAEGGAQRVTAWLPLVSGDTRWSRAVELLRGADTTSHDNSVVRAPARVIPVAGHPVYFQAVFQWLPGGSPRLVHVSALLGDSVAVAPTLAAMLGGSTSTTSPAAPQGFRVRADSLYRAMRAALERGDWPAFGRAFDALGSALGRPTP